MISRVMNARNACAKCIIMTIIMKVLIINQRLRNCEKEREEKKTTENRRRGYCGVWVSMVNENDAAFD